MGKKGKGHRFKTKKQKRDAQLQPKPHAPYQDDYSQTNMDRGNFKMEAYYALQGIHNSYYDNDGNLVPCQTSEEKNEERIRWRTCIGKILPASFRTAFDISETLKESLEKELEELVQAQAKAALESNNDADGEAQSDNANEEEIRNPIQKIPFLPHAYQFLDISRKSMRKDPTMKAIFEWMKRQTDAGFITRQETVSMVPPVVLDPQPDDAVLDMCAAPGSKTCQILEKLSPNGSMVANDSSFQRAYMLVHQLRRIMHNNPVVLVTSAEAQFFPQSLTFDRILADVPCSGDGTSRKNIGIWKKWNQLGALALHTLQLDIAWKGVAMLKVGGFMCYSTCSYNPVENEAVVAELLRRAKGSLELVDAPLEGFKVRPGMSHWKVLAEEKSNRQMMNEKKKNNAKMKQRRAEWEKKDMETATAVGGDNIENVTSEVKVESSLVIDSREDDAEKEDGDGENGIKAPKVEDAGPAETAEADARLDDEVAATHQGDKDDNGFKRPKFEPPSSWDDDTLLGLAKTAGLMHFNSVDEVPDHLKKRVKKSCFPPTEEEARSLHLDKCIRCLSHDNDTGGFFVALLKKVAPVSRNEARQNRRYPEETDPFEVADTGGAIKRVKLDDSGKAGIVNVDNEEKINDEAPDITGDAVLDGVAAEEMDIAAKKPRREVKSFRLDDGKGGKHKELGRDDFVDVDEKKFGPLTEFFGFTESFPKEQIMTRAIGDSKVLYFLAKSVKENFIDKGIQQRVTIIGSGVKAFVRQTSWGSDCEYRLSQEGVHFLLPHMSKRKLLVDIDDFIHCMGAEGKAIPLSEFSEEFFPSATSMPVGPFVALLKGYETDFFSRFFLTMWRCRGSSVNCMVNKPEVEGMQSKLAVLKEEMVAAAS